MNNPPSKKKRTPRIVLTGGPGGGKTTASDLFRREIGEDVVLVPEAATLLFSGGFPRNISAEAVKATQNAIYHVQKNLEKVQSAIYPERILLCDRGTVDGAAYWPGTPKEFFHQLGTSLMEEIHCYDAVIFFESAAVGRLSIEGGNPIRIENLEDAILLDRRLRDLWSQHSHFTLVPHNPSFFKKITAGLAIIESIVFQLKEGPLRPNVFGVPECYSPEKSISKHSLKNGIQDSEED